MWARVCVCVRVRQVLLSKHGAEAGCAVSCCLCSNKITLYLLTEDRVPHCKQSLWLFSSQGIYNIEKFNLSLCWGSTNAPLLPYLVGGGLAVLRVGSL